MTTLVDFVSDRHSNLRPTDLQIRRSADPVFAPLALSDLGQHRNRRGDGVCGQGVQVHHRHAAGALFHCPRLESTHTNHITTTTSSPFSFTTLLHHYHHTPPPPPPPRPPHRFPQMPVNFERYIICRQFGADVRLLDLAAS